MLFFAGLSSSLLSSSLVTSSLTEKPLITKTPLTPPRKRKPVRGKSADIIEKKKPREQDDKKTGLSSQLLSGTGTTSGLFQLSLLGNKGSSLLSSRSDYAAGSSLSTGLKSDHGAGSKTTGSSLLGRTALSGSFGSSLQSKLDGKTSSSLMSDAKTSLNLTTSLLSSSSGTGKSSLGFGTSLLQPSLGVSSLSSTAGLLGSGLSSTLSSRSSPSHAAMATSFLGSLPTKSGLMGSRQESVESGKGVQVKTGKPTKSRKRARLGGYETDAPVYNLSTQIKDEAEIEIPKFVPPDKDPSLMLTGARLHDVNGMKVCDIL